MLLQIHQLKVIAKDIVYHDEVLTMSARVNILNNKPYWLERYRQHSQLLDQALANAKSNDVPIDGLLLKLQAANQSLIAIEESAFKLIDEGKKQQATNLLFGDEYTTKKLVYTHNIEGIVEQTSIFEQNLADEYQSRERLLFVLFIGVTIAFLILIAVTYIAKRIKNKQIEQLILHDSLTSLLNRRSFDVALFHEFRRYKRENRKIAIAILDVDNFKRFNDIYGHAAGDNALTQIGETLGKLTRRSTEFAYRIGGEEFALILSISESSEAEKIATSILTEIQALNIAHEGNQPYNKITISIGLVIVSSDIDITPKEAYTKADNALYDAKNNGRNALKSVNV